MKSYVNPKIDHGCKSKIHGLGLCATENIVKGEIIAIKNGHLLTRDEYLGLDQKYQTSSLQIAEDFFIGPTNDKELEDTMVYMNHSCNPNCGGMGNIITVASRDINQGEEVVRDYAQVVSSPDFRLECSCGESVCRGLVTGNDWKRSDLQKQYGNYFSAYLLKKINDLNA